VDRKERDKHLWTAWKANPNKGNLSPLLRQVDPILQKEVGRWAGGGVATPVLMVQAKKLALQAFDTYNPTKAALNTHLTNQLKGLSRQPYTYISPARMPEHRQIKLKTYKNSEEILKERLGREPTAQELSADLAWSIQEVGRYRKEIRKEYSTSQPIPPGFETSSADDGIVGFIYHDLNTQDQKVFEHTTGYGGAELLSTRDLMSRTGLTQGQVSHSKRRLKKIISTATGMQ
jgi:DNA-directed RNA polymerase specialized sigma subunit